MDKDRIAAAGGSFGGYMMNWFAVNDIAKQFKCLITHCSVWNFESMWGTTDELWFDEWEHGGLPWEKPRKYAEFSPHKKAGEPRQVQDADARSSTTTSTSAARSARGTSCSRALAAAGRAERGS